jgi:hypothetical protein
MKRHVENLDVMMTTTTWDDTGVDGVATEKKRLRLDRPPALPPHVTYYLDII